MPLQWRPGLSSNESDDRAKRNGEFYCGAAASEGPSLRAPAASSKQLLSMERRNHLSQRAQFAASSAIVRSEWVTDNRFLILIAVEPSRSYETRGICLRVAPSEIRRVRNSA